MGIKKKEEELSKGEIQADLNYFIFLTPICMFVPGQLAGTIN